MQQAQIDELYPRALPAHRQAFSALGPALFAEFGLTGGPLRLPFFLAQIGHESAGLTRLRENLRYRAERLVEVFPRHFADVGAARTYAMDERRLANRVYGNRFGCGDEASGDGFRYRGQGYLQLTWRDNYRAIGKVAGLDLEAEPDLACAPATALRVACAYWRWRNLNPLCDRGDFMAVTRKVNAAAANMPDRRAWLDKVRRVFAAPTENEGDPVRIARLQRALQRRGYWEIGAADGEVGKRTMAAIARFRIDHGLPAGGIDDALTTALGLA